MPTKYDNRRARLRLLVELNNDERGRGGLAEVAKRCGLSRATLHQAMHDLPVRVARGASPRAHTHQLGDDGARAVEVGLGLPTGSMDDPLPSTLCFEEHKDHGLALKDWLAQAIATGVMSEVEAQLELARMRDLYPGVGAMSTADAQAIDAPGVETHGLVLGTTGAGRTAAWQ